MSSNQPKKSKAWMVTGGVAALSLVLSIALLFRSTPDFEDHWIRMQYFAEARQWEQGTHMIRLLLKKTFEYTSRLSKISFSQMNFS